MRQCPRPCPSNLTATMGNQPDQVKLLWNDNSGNETNFLVEEKLDSDPNPADWTQVGSALAADTETDTVTLPNDNQVYDLAVFAINPAGNSTLTTTKASGIALESVFFAGNGSQTIQRDNGSGNYTGPSGTTAISTAKSTRGTPRPFPTERSVTMRIQVIWKTIIRLATCVVRRRQHLHYRQRVSAL